MRLFLTIGVLLTIQVLIYAKDVIRVENAGLELANGIYTQKGVYNDHPLYIKENCEIRYKGCRSKWVLVVNRTAWYKNANDSEICPLVDWQMTCAAKKDSLHVPSFSNCNNISKL